MMQSIRDLIADDAYAITFQTMGQYRTALLAALDQASSLMSESMAPPPASNGQRFSLQTSDLVARALASAGLDRAQLPSDHLLPRIRWALVQALYCAEQAYVRALLSRIAQPGDASAEGDKNHD